MRARWFTLILDLYVIDAKGEVVAEVDKLLSVRRRAGVAEEARA